MEVHLKCTHIRYGIYIYITTLVFVIIGKYIQNVFFSPFKDDCHMFPHTESIWEAILSIYIWSADLMEARSWTHTRVYILLYAHKEP